MKALKLRILILSVLFAVPLSVAAASQNSSDENNTQEAKTEKAEANDQGGDRGFDPCLLNPSLAVCTNKQ